MRTNLKHEFIWATGTKDYKLCKITGILYILSTFLCIIIAQISLAAKGRQVLIAENTPSPILSNMSVICSYSLLVFIVLNFAYISHVFKRMSIYRKGKEYMLFGTIIQYKDKRKDRRDLILYTREGRKDVQAYESVAFGKSKKSDKAIIIPHNNEYWVSYY